MRFVLLILLTVHTWAVYLPPAHLGKPYSEKISSQPLSACALDPNAKQSPGLANGIPEGLSVAADGTVSGTTNAEAITYQFGVACSEAKFVIRMKVIQ